MKKKVILICLAILTFLLALGITLYPIISTAYYEKHQAQLQYQYQEQVKQINTSKLDKVREDAVAYNKSLLSGIDAFGKDAISNAATEYGDLLNPTGNGVMGYVRVPSIGVNLPIMHGTQSNTLEQGVGHLLGTSLPVGGKSTHTVLTAHSGMASAKMFSDLDQLEIGDVFYINVLNETLAYQVDQIKTVLPHDTTYLGIAEGEDMVTMVTCTPFGVNTHRLLVRGSRIPYMEAVDIELKQPQKAAKQSTWEQEYMKGIYIALGIVLILGAVFLTVRLIRRKRHGS